MTRVFRHRPRAFTLIELIMALAIFAIAAVSLAGAINLVSLSVTESIDDAELREDLRAVLLEAARDPLLAADSRRTDPNERGIAFAIEVEQLSAENREGEALGGLFSVTVTALRAEAAGRMVPLDSASTYAYPGMFQ